MSALLTRYRTQLMLALAILAFALGSLHPYLDASGLCGLGGCQKPAQSSPAAPGAEEAGGHGGPPGCFSSACLAAVLAALLAAPAFVPFTALARGTRHLSPAEACILLGTPPPQALPSR